MRRIHYLLVSEDDVCKVDGKVYENTESCWDYLCSASKQARYLGLVEVEAFVDRRNPDPHIYIADDPRDHEDWGIEDPVWILPSISNDTGEIDLSIPSPSVYGYGYSENDQPYHLEVWVEKSTQNDVLVPICQQFHVNLVTSLGFQSITSVASFLARVRKPARIFYISDFDPGGRDMPVGVARQIEFWGNADVKLECLALTAAQIQNYQLPRTPIKDSDLRKAKFEERCGEGAVELDALEALYPGELANMLREAIEPYRDDTLAERLDGARYDAEQVVETEWQQVTAAYQVELSQIEERARSIVEGYQGRLREISSGLGAELRPLHERLIYIRQQVIEARDNLVIELPGRPEGEVDGLDELHWLFDSEREYLEQLEVYKDFRENDV